MLLEVGNHGHLATVNGCVAQPVGPVFGNDLYGDEVPARAADEYFDVFDFGHLELTV